MQERLKQLRKALGIKQAEFASRIGVSPGAIGNYERGRNIPIDAVIQSICREFHVNELWLRTGEGAMFAEADDYFAAIAHDYDLNPEAISIIKTFVELPPQTRRAIIDFVRSITNQLSSAPIHSPIDDAEELYLKSLSIAPDPDVSASPTTAVTDDNAV